MASDDEERHRKVAYQANYMSAFDAKQHVKVTQKLASSPYDIKEFHQLEPAVQEYLDKEYKWLKGKQVMTVIGPRYCIGGSCGCRGYIEYFEPESWFYGGDPRGPPHPRILRYKTHKNGRDQLEPQYITIEDGQIKFVEYIKIDNGV